MKLSAIFFPYLMLLTLFFSCKTPQKYQTKELSSMVKLEDLSQAFKSPNSQYTPETWFHFNGNNISKEGITLDLEAIKYAGLQGIHLFNKNGRPYPEIEQIKVLSPEWEAMVRHTADECKRLGLKFTMQNCSGWSMTGALGSC